MEIDRGKKLKLMLTGALAGLINGFFGGGGGMVLIPMLTGFIGLEDRRSFATSVAVMLPLSTVSAAVYFISGAIPLSSAAPFLIGGLLGGAASGLSFKRIPTALLRRIFALFIIYGGIRSFL
ncbi:MAG: TSUP family transporter [Oscillospiraceae bacterium]